MLQAAIFDMDGLLIDSEPYWARADSIFFPRHGKKYSPEFNHAVMGMNQRDVMEYAKKNYGIEGDTQELIQERLSILYSLLLKNIKLMKGAEEVIHVLHTKGIPLAIATSGHTIQRTKEILEKLSIAKFFSVIVTGDDVVHAKPDPEIYILTAKKMDVQPGDCLVFEDAPKGVQAGKAAGMTVYGVNRDKKLYAKLQEAGADKVFTSLKEVVV